MPREARAHSGVDGFHLPSRQPELAGTREQALAVERHDRRRSIGPGEQIRSDALRFVMPDLRAVQRQHHRSPPADAEKDRQFRKQAVAVDVHDIRSFERRDERTPDSQRAAWQVRSKARGHAAGRASRHPRDRAREVGVTRCARRVGDVRNGVARLEAPCSKLAREQRICSLVRRQMRGHVEDVHSASSF